MMQKKLVALVMAVGIAMANTGGNVAIADTISNAQFAVAGDNARQARAIEERVYADQYRHYAALTAGRPAGSAVATAVAAAYAQEMAERHLPTGLTAVADGWEPSAKIGHESEHVSVSRIVAYVFLGLGFVGIIVAILLGWRMPFDNMGLVSYIVLTSAAFAISGLFFLISIIGAGKVLVIVPGGILALKCLCRLIEEMRWWRRQKRKGPCE